MFGKDYWDGRYGRLFFSPDGDGGGGGDGDAKPSGDQKPQDDDPLAGLTDAQKAALQKRIDSAASNARKEGERAGLTKAQQDANAKLEEERVKKEQEDALKAGEFDKVRASLESERDKHKTEAETTAQQLADAEEQLASVVAEKVKTLEATADKDLIAAFPKDAKPLDQLRWLNDPRTLAAMRTAEEAQRVSDANAKPKVPGNPKPNANGKEPVKSLVNTRSF